MQVGSVCWSDILGTTCRASRPDAVTADECHFHLVTLVAFSGKPGNWMLLAGRHTFNSCGGSWLTMIKDARVGCHNSTAAAVHPCKRVASYCRRRSWISLRALELLAFKLWDAAAAARTLCCTLCPKSFSVGEQGSAFTGNDQLEGDIDRKRQLLAKPIRPLCHRVEMSARLAPTPEISFFLFSKLRRIWQHSNPTYRLMFPGLSLLNGIPGCKGAFQLGEQVTDGLLRPGLRADNFPTLEIFLTKHQLWVMDQWRGLEKWRMINSIIDHN